MNKAHRHIFCLKINILWIAPPIYYIISYIILYLSPGWEEPRRHSGVHLGDFIEQAAFKICLYPGRKETILSHEKEKFFKCWFAILVRKSSSGTFCLTKVSREYLKKKIGISIFLPECLGPHDSGEFAQFQERESALFREQCIIRKSIFLFEVYFFQRCSL
jgi:hypothetical protein